MAQYAKVHSKSDSTVLQARAQKWVQSGILEFEIPYEEDCVSYLREVRFPIPYQSPPKIHLTVEMLDGDYFGAEAQVAERRDDAFIIALRNVQHGAAKGIVMWRAEL